MSPIIAGVFRLVDTAAPRPRMSQASPDSHTALGRYIHGELGTLAQRSAPRPLRVRSVRA